MTAGTYRPARPGPGRRRAPRPPRSAARTARQCGRWLARGPDGATTVRPRALAAHPSGPPGRAGLCRKGWTPVELLDSAERLRTPLVRRAGEPRPASWETALGLIVQRIREIQWQSGPDAVAVFGGGLTDEKAYALGKFARVPLGSATIGYNGRFCMSSAAVAANRVFGLDRGMPFPPADVAGAPAGLAGEALVCQCDGGPRAEILWHRAAGSRTVGSIATATRATTGCGGCRPLVEELLAEPARPGGRRRRTDRSEDRSGVTGRFRWPRPP
ncbi:molybdopterin-dependent oxidoreductase [Streptomyces sp. JW3]|uniref:(2Fe-2S)-binding protein n=1 Tax=Streptomyces sp. JW3 TaxID=3456955 RepID=UPI003FA4ACDC